jgi:hypothetical protein
LTKNGSAVPNTTASHRGRIEFVDPQADYLAAPRFAPSGEATYQTEIVAGSYDIYYAPLCNAPEDLAPLPCHTSRVLIIGCGS